MEDPVTELDRLVAPSAAYLAGDCPLPVPPAAPSRLALAATSRAASKALFDAGLRREDDSVPLIEALLQKIADDRPTTRSQARKVGGKKAKVEPPKLERTPLQELYIGTGDVGGQDADAGLSDEAVWAQMELRANAVKSWMSTLLQDPDEIDEEAMVARKKAALGMEAESSDEESEDEDSEDEFDLEGMDFEDLSTDDGSGSGPDDSDVDDPAADTSYSRPLNDTVADRASPKKGKGASRAEPDSTEELSLDNIDSRPSSGSSSRPKGKPSPVDDDFFSLSEFEAEADEGERQMARRLRRLQGDGDAGDSSEEDEEDVDLFVNPFGSGDAMDEDEEDGAMDLGDVADIKYSDFFDPPPRRAKARPQKPPPPAKKRKAPIEEDADDRDDPTAPQSAVNGVGKRPRVSFADSVTVKDIPSANRGMHVAEMVAAAKRQQALRRGVDLDDGDDDDEDDDDDGMAWASELLDDNAEGSSSGSGSDSSDGSDEEDIDEDAEGVDTMSRMDRDLFDDGLELDSEEEESAEENDDDDSDDDPTPNGSDVKLSRHARRLRVLSKQIAELEAQSIAKKDWTMKGEASARDRPENSLLEQDLDFEHIAKIVPAVTEEKSMGLEDLIKRRILENDFDDVVRRRPVDMKAFLPSRMLELQDTASSKSLAEVYADEYRDSRARANGEEVTDVRDTKLEKAHDEIKVLFDTLFGQLDALSNAHFTPKAPTASISTLSNMPAISMESALPTSASTATLLAPEEVFSADPKAVQRDRSNLSHAQKQLERKQRKKARSSLSKTLGKLTGKTSTKAQKEESLKKLVGTKGVTVIGKQPVGKGKGKPADSKQPQSAVGLKL